MNQESKETKQLKRLGKIIGQTSQELPSSDFDQRFWSKFEALDPATLQAPLQPARLVFSPKLVGACAGVLLLAMVFAFAKDQPRMDVAQGIIERTSASGISLAVEQGERIKKGDTIRTDKTEWAILELKNGYRFKMHPQTEIRILDLKPVFRPGTTVLHLVRGEVFVSIGDDGERKYPIKVVTPNAYAKAIGTQFSVSHDDSSESNSVVRVVKGLVEAGLSLVNEQEAEASVLVQKGQELVLKDKDWPLKPHLIPSTKFNELNELFQFSKTGQAILLISMSPNRVNELLEPCALYLRYAPQATELEPISAIVRKIQIASDLSDSSQHFEAAKNLESLINKQNTVNRVPALLFVGAYFSYIDRHDEAVRVFEGIADSYPNSSFKSLALLAAAETYSKQLNQTDEARALAKRILKEHPLSYEVGPAKELAGQ